MLKLWKNLPYSAKLKRLNVLSRNRKKRKKFYLKSPNKTEIKILSILKKIDKTFEFVGDGRKPIGNKWPDFICEKRKLIVEYNSKYFHRQDTLKTLIDRARLFKSEGYDTVYIFENEANEKDIMRKLSSI